MSLIAAGLAVNALLTLVLLFSALALDFPVLTGRVVDDAGILDLQTRAALTQKLDEFETKTTDQLVVVTLKSLQGTSIEDFGVELGRHWRIGQKDKNNGVLLIVAPNERKVRIEVGYGLEGALTDAVSRLIIENAITAALPRRRFPGGITRGVDDIISVLSGDAAEWQQRAAKRPEPQTRWAPILRHAARFRRVRSGVPHAGRQPSRGTAVAAGAAADWSSGWSSGLGLGLVLRRSSGGGFSGGGFSGRRRFVRRRRLVGKLVRAPR